MKRRPPRSTRTNTLLPDTTLFRSTAQPQSATDNRIIQLMRLSPSATLTLALLLSAPAYAQDTTARDGEDDFHTDQAIVVTAPYVRRSEEHTSELQSLMRISYAVFCLKKKKKANTNTNK